VPEPQNNYFDEAVAARYDESTDEHFDPDVIAATADFLADLAGEGAALEFAIGTGRIAIPLAERGVVVHGIEFSQAMVARLREKPGAEDIVVTIGDMATTRIDGSFSLVYLVFNTINNLTTQDAQVACFQNAAHHLLPRGRFVVEVLVPGLQRLPTGERLQAFHHSDDRWGIDEVDVVTQAFWSHHLAIRDGEVRTNSVPFRYVWPSELDLMARLAGLELEGRYAGWDQSPFTETTRSHVSVWIKRG
jgi:SAM-dependent methyltransferase